MAVTFPLPRAAFADRLLIEGGGLRLMRFEESSGTARGEVINSEIGRPKWAAEVHHAPIQIAFAEEIAALIERLGSSQQFFMFNPRRPYPLADPTGALLGSAAPTIHTVGGDNRSLRVTGLPSGYALSVGDMISFTRGSDPVRWSLHRIMETVLASAGGLTPLFEVEPQLKTGTATGRSVFLRKAVTKMQITSFDPGQARGNVVTGMSFAAIEAF